MKVYYVCEYCEEVFLVSEAGGPGGAISMQGICDDCAMEMGMVDAASLRSQSYFN